MHCKEAIAWGSLFLRRDSTSVPSQGAFYFVAASMHVEPISLAKIGHAGAAKYQHQAVLAAAPWPRVVGGSL